MEAGYVPVGVHAQTLTVDVRDVRLTHLDRPLYPSGFTKADVVAYYARMAPAVLPHELETASEEDALRFGPDEAVERFSRDGDPFADVLEIGQTLPVE